MDKPLYKNLQITDSNKTVKFGVCQCCLRKRTLNICIVTEIYRQIDNVYLNKLLNVHYSTLVWKKTGYGSKIAQHLNSPVHEGTLALPAMSHFYIHSTLFEGQPHNKTHILPYQKQKIPLSLLLTSTLNIIHMIEQMDSRLCLTFIWIEGECFFIFHLYLFFT